MRRMHTKLQAAAENTYASWRYGYAGLASGRQENVIRMRKENFNQPLLKLRMRREGDLLCVIWDDIFPRKSNKYKAVNNSPEFRTYSL